MAWSSRCRSSCSRAKTLCIAPFACWATAPACDLRPLINFRPLEAAVSSALSSDYALTVRGDRYEVSAGPDLPILRLAVKGSQDPSFTADGGSKRECFYDIEAQRGYDSRGWLIVENHMLRLVGRHLSRKDNPALLYIPGVTGAGRGVRSNARSVGPSSKCRPCGHRPLSVL